MTETLRHLFLLFRSVSLLVRILDPTPVDIANYCKLNKQLAIYCAKHCTGWEYSHYFYKLVAHRPEIMERHGTLAGNSTTSQEAQNKILQAKLQTNTPSFFNLTFCNCCLIKITLTQKHFFWSVYLLHLFYTDSEQ